MLVTNSWECLLLETFKLICTRILCLITLNRYSRVTFSYQHVEKTFQYIKSAYSNHCILKKNHSYLRKQAIDMKYQKISHSYLKYFKQSFILEMYVVFDQFRELQQTQAREAFGDSGQMYNFHDGLKEQCTLIEFFLDGNR